jgi:hypothetical protein
MDSTDPRLLPPAADPAARFAPVPPTVAGRPAARPSGQVPGVSTRTDHQVTLRRLKGATVVATALSVGAFAGLVVSHPVGSASSPTAPAPADGSTTTNANHNVAPVDPFFDPNPGGGGDAAPAFGGGTNGGGTNGGGSAGGGFTGGGGGGPAFQSGGS